MSIGEAYTAIESAGNACTECGRCVPRCEVPHDAQGRSIGTLAKAFSGLAAGVVPDTDERRTAFLAAVSDLAGSDPSIIYAIRRCCMCGYCTVPCPENIEARTVFAALREILSDAGVTTEEGFESTQVDKQWHIFSVYRAVYGIHYVDLPHMDRARDLGADTLFFPGCPLASYAPELTREVYAFLGSQGINAVFSEACCGSPLKSAGFGDRARSFKQNIAREVEAAGIRRIVCVCPGCMRELEGASPSMASVEFVALPALLAEAGISIDGAALSGAVCSRKGDGAIQEGVPVHATVSDSCFDRKGVFGAPLRSLLPVESLVEMDHSGENTRCCGAGGAVSLVDPDLSVTRARRVFDEGGSCADLIITNCPTCAYTLAYQERTQGAGGGYPAHVNYLELAFGSSFDWGTVFSQLEGMWSGEYGPWVIEQLT